MSHKNVTVTMQKINLARFVFSDGGELDGVASLKAAVLVSYCTSKQSRTPLCSLRADWCLHNLAVGEHMLNAICQTEN